MNKGILHGIGAYALWGLFPLYWKFLLDVPATQIIGHRIGWSFLLLVTFVCLSGKYKEFISSVSSIKLFITYLTASALLTVNWFVYVWGVNSGKIVEASLGYFINPLFCVLLGVVFLRERLRFMQWIPVILAAGGVAYLTFSYGIVPWIALSLAFTFGIYGLVKKLAPLDSLFGLTFETAIAFPAAAAFLIFAESGGGGPFLNGGIRTDLLLIGTGIITSIPLLLFASAARKVPLTTIGILQFISPTLQFLIGIIVYSEKFEITEMIGFGLVWFALIIFLLENYLSEKPLQQIQAAE
jgi:chloramphenicol-sensitive protein RarD